MTLRHSDPLRAHSVADRVGEYYWILGKGRDFSQQATEKLVWKLGSAGEKSTHTILLIIEMCLEVKVSCI